MAVTTEMGLVRIIHVDANDNVIAELLEKYTSEFGSKAADTSKANNDPQKMPKVKKRLSTVLKQDDKLKLMFYSDAALTAASTPGTAEDELDLRIPVTFRNVRTGVKYEKTLVVSDFTINGEDTAGAGLYEIVSAAHVWVELASYVIPAQSELKLGHDIQDVRVDSALNFWMEDAVA